MIRMCMASARLRLSSRVEAVDVGLAEMLMRHHLSIVAGTADGTLDMGRLTGESMEVRDVVQRIKVYLERAGGSTVADVSEGLGLVYANAKGVLIRMRGEGDVIESNGRYDIMRRM